MAIKHSARTVEPGNITFGGTLCAANQYTQCALRQPSHGTTFQPTNRRALAPRDSWCAPSTWAHWMRSEQSSPPAVNDRVLWMVLICEWYHHNCDTTVNRYTRSSHVSFRLHVSVSLLTVSVDVTYMYLKHECSGKRLISFQKSKTSKYLVFLIYVASYELQDSWGDVRFCMQIYFW